MPRTRGKGTEAPERPWRVKSSERFRPQAFTRIRTWPGEGVGMGRVSSLRTSGPPGPWITAAFMVDMVGGLMSLYNMVCVWIDGLVRLWIKVRRCVGDVVM